MARYLSPAKIGLFVLIELYTEEAVPSDAILPVLSFITSHISAYESAKASTDAQDARWKRAEKTVSLIITLKDFEKLLGSYQFVLGMPGRKLWDQFLDKLWAINSLNALNVFFERLTLLLKPTKEELRRMTESGREPDDSSIKISRNSPFGVFIRRAHLEYERLRFHDFAELWKDFVKYRQPTSHYQRRKNPGLSNLSFDSVLLLGQQEEWDDEGTRNLAAVAYGDMLTGGNTGPLPVSTDDIETLLEFQVTQMQKFGNRVPLEIRHQFHDLLQDSFLVPSLSHYLSFLDAWRAGNYTKAFDLLHRYFDYTMQNRDRLYYQYALMNLAVLQADFGCDKEAVAAMLETVSTARENRDMTCLNFALNWLFHFGRAHPSLVHQLESDSMLGTGKESLAYLRVKAKETGMWTLWSSVLLSEAKISLAQGESVATSLESMVRSSQVIVEKNLRTMFGSQTSLSMALWERLGLTHLSSLACELFLRCHSSDALFDDELRLTCRSALLVAERGKYDEALQRLEDVEKNSLRSWKPGQYWNKYRGIIKLKRDLHHNNLDGAEQLLGQLLQSKADDLEPELALTIDTLNVDYLTRRGDLDAAFSQVQDLLAIAKEENKDVALKVQLLLLKASLLCQCGRPQRGFSTAMRAANTAWRARLTALLWRAIGVVAEILTSMREFTAAADMLVAVIPRALECEVSTVSAELYSCLANANMGLAGTVDSKSRERTEYLTKAVAAIQKSFDHYSAVEDVGKQCEMMAKKATIMKLMGDLERAADYAAAYVSLKNHAEALTLGGP